ncbi:hypothetical protein [Comamonas composti]|uniref:hypothetical protein n=1 Tax=Comamonas composti TaxID=408558 RepID=UPI0004046080|nr:hypothetical protein [Comamonas composti]
MGFTQSLLRLAVGLGAAPGPRPASEPDIDLPDRNLHPGGAKACADAGHAAPAGRVQVLSFARRPARRRRLVAASRKPDALQAFQPCASTCHEPGQTEHVRAQPALRIVQRRPVDRPECLLISGRMADVCAALERMGD